MQRHTLQKDIVAGTLNEMTSHPTADEVYERVHEKQPGISKSTVYRILSNMVASGNALRVRINNGADRFDYQAFPHYHVRCTCCGRVDDAMIPQLGDIDQEAGKSSGYLVESHTLQFDGICPECQAASRKEECA